MFLFAAQLLYKNMNYQRKEEKSIKMQDQKA